MRSVRDMQTQVSAPPNAAWTTRQAAQYLGVSESYLEGDRIGRKRIPFIRIGRAVRYDPQDLAAFRERSKEGVDCAPTKQTGDHS